MRTSDYAYRWYVNQELGTSLNVDLEGAEAYC